MYPSANYRANVPQGSVNPQHPSMGMMNTIPQNQYFFPQNHPSMNPNMVPNGGYHGNQMMPNQFQPSPTSHVSSQHSVPHQGHASQLPDPKFQSTKRITEPNIPPHTSHSNRLEIQSSEENFSDDGDVVPDTPVGMLNKLHLDDSCGSLKSVEPVAKAQMDRKQDQGLVGNLQSQNATKGGVPSANTG